MLISCAKTSWVSFAKRISVSSREFELQQTKHVQLFWWKVFDVKDIIYSKSNHFDLCIDARNNLKFSSRKIISHRQWIENLIPFFFKVFFLFFLNLIHLRQTPKPEVPSWDSSPKFVLGVFFKNSFSNQPSTHQPPPCDVSESYVEDRSLNKSCLSISVGIKYRYYNS